jgi:glutathione S-transferase
MTLRIIGSLASWTRDCRPRWLLEELGIGYEHERIDLFGGQGRSPEHLARHPLGKVPVLEDGEVTMWESGAVVTYLLERYGDGRLAPPPGTPARARYLQWFFFAATSLEPVTTKIYANLRFRVGQPDAEERLADAHKELTKLRRALDPALERGPYLLGEDFSAADIMMGTSLHWAAKVGGLTEAPVLKRYYDRLAERPAFQKTFSEGEP